MNLKDRLKMSIAKRSGAVVLRSDVSGLGSSSQLSEAFRCLLKEGRLLKLGSGIYAKAVADSDGRVKLASPTSEIAKEVFARLGVEARITSIDSSSGEKLYLLDTPKRRISRSLNFTDGRVVYQRNDAKATHGFKVGLPTDVDLLPKSGVSEFIRQYASAKNVVYRRSGLDDWAEAVTRAAGDDVRLDETEKLLVVLTKKHLLSGRQAARLLTNYMEEASVRSVQGLRDRRLSP